MSFTSISLEKAGVPQVIEQPSVDEILELRKARLVELAESHGGAEYAANLAAPLNWRANRW